MGGRRRGGTSGDGGVALRGDVGAGVAGGAGCLSAGGEDEPGLWGDPGEAWGGGGDGGLEPGGGLSAFGHDDHAGGGDDAGEAEREILGEHQQRLLVDAPEGERATIGGSVRDGVGGASAVWVGAAEGPGDWGELCDGGREGSEGRRPGRQERGGV